MSWFEDSNIKKSYIVQTVSDVGIFSACTQIYLTNISPCVGDTINITGNLGVSGNISGTTYFGDGSQLSGIVTTDNFVTGGVYSASSETLYFTGTTGFTPFSVDVSALLDDTNNYVTGGTYNSSTDIVTLTRNDNVNINITGVSDTFTTGATYNEGTELITFVRNDGNTYTADLAAIASATTNSFTTGATLNGNIIEFANSVLGLDYYNVDLTPIVSGATNGYTTGATLNGNIIEFANNLFGLDYYNVDLTSLVSGKLDTTTFNTYTADTQTTLNGKLDTTTFNTYSGSVETQINNKTENTNFTSHTGDTTIHYTKGSINLSELGSSAHTHSISEVINLQTELDAKVATTLFNTYTGDTETALGSKLDISSFNTYSGSVETQLENKTDNTNFVSHTGDTTIHYTKGSINLSDLGSSAHTHSISEVVNLQTELDTKVSTTLFNTYTGDTETALGNKLETTTFNSYTGSVVDVFVSSGNANAGTQQLSFTNTSGGTFNVTNAAALFSDNDVNVTGGTYDINTGCVTFTTNSGTTFDVCGFVTGITDTFVTGGTLTGENLVLERNSGVDVGNIDLSGLVSGKLEISLFNTYTGDTQTALGNKTDNTNFVSHTGDTTIHYTKGSINLSELGSSAHTHSISEVVNLQTNLDAKVATTLFNTYTGDTETTLGNKLDTTTFNTYSGSVQTELDSKVESASNVGGANNVFSGKSGTDLQFRTISGGSNTTVTTVGGVIKIDTTGGGSSTTPTLQEVLSSGNTTSGNDIIMSESDDVVFKYSGFNNRINTEPITTHRNINFPDNDGTVALVSDTTGYTETTLFNTYTGDTETTLNGKVETTLFNTYTGDTETTLNSKTDNTDFVSHTGDTTIHFTKGSINLSDLGSSAHTHSISEVINLQTELDSKVETTLFNTYTGDTETALDSKLPTTTFNSYTGSVVDVFVSSGNANVSTQQLSFTNTTGGTFNVTNATALFSDNDINVTGGTYNPSTGCVTFTTNSGTTFDVCGFVTGITDTFVTGYTYSDNTFTLTRNQGLADLTSTINTMTGLTVNGVLSATTYTGITLDGIDDVTSNIPTTPDNTYQGRLLYFDVTDNQWVTGEEYVSTGNVTIWAKKGTAGTIDKGCPVYITGFDNDIHEVELANATTASTMPVIGFTGEDFDNAGVYPLITFGKLVGVDTTSTVSTINPNGETWAVNDVLYMNTTDGGLTKFRPPGTNTQIQRIAKVLRVATTSGQLFIFNTARTAGLPNLTTDYVWLGNGNDTPQEVIKTDLGVSVTGFSYDNNNTFTITDDNSGSYVATINQMSGLTVDGTLTLNSVGGTTSVTNLGVDASGNVVSGDTGGDVFKVGTPVNNQIGVWTGDGTIEGDSNLTWDGSEINVTDADGNLTEVRADWLRVFNETDDANLFLYGYGTGHRGEIVLGAANGDRTTPTATLNGNNVATITAFGHSGTGFRQGGNISFAATENYTEGTNYGTRFVIQTVADGSTTLETRYATDGDGNHDFTGDVSITGNVGIGTTIPQEKLHVSTGNDLNSGNISFLIGGTAGTNARTGRIIKNTSSPYEMTIRANDFATGGNLILNDTGGNVGIGKTSPTEALDVSGNTVMSGTLNIGTIGGTTSVTNLGIDASGNVVSGTTGGTSYWEETTSTIKLDTGETTRDVVEINTGGANTLSGTYSLGNLLVGDGNTFGNGQTVRRSFIGGNAVVVGASEAFQTSIVFGQTITVEGTSTSVFGASHVVKGNYNFTAGQNNDLYGDNLTAIGTNNILGTSSVNINRSIVIGEDADSYADDQIVIGFGIGTNASWGAAKAIYVGIEDSRASSGWFSDPTIGSGTNFALGGNNTMRTDVGVIKAGAGRGILYLNNYTGSSVSEPTVDISDSVGLWAKNRDTGVTGLIVKAENGGKTWIGDRIGINTVTPTEALDVSGNTVMSGTLNIGTVNAGTAVKNLAVDTNDNVVASSVPITTTYKIDSNADITLYSDSEISITWDVSQTDVDMEILTDPTTSQVHVTKRNAVGGITAFDLENADGVTQIDSSMGNDDRIDLNIFAPSDSTYPHYRVSITRSNSITYTNTPFLIIVEKWSSYD